MKKNLVVILVAVLLLTITVVVSAATPNAFNATFEAVGVAKISVDADNEQQGIKIARKMALRKAYRHLSEELKSAYAEGSFQGIVDQDTGLDKKMMHHILRKARLIDEQFTDGYYKVKLKLNIQDVRVKSTENILQGPYTGLFIDARGLDGQHLQRGMSPLIVDTDGNIIYGNVIPSAEFVAKNGMVDYAETEDDIDLTYAGLSRAGNHPLYIKALNLKHFNENIVISIEDAALVMDADHKTGFLNKTSVVFAQ